jgi:hypothetical protein
MKRLMMNRSAPFTKEELAAAFGLSTKNVRVARLQNSVEHRLNKVMKGVDEAFRTLIQKSSVEHGDFAARWPRGAVDRGTLLNSLRHTLKMTSKSSKGLSLSLAIYSVAPHAKYIAIEDREGHAPPPGVILRWAIRNLPGWSGLPNPSPTATLDAVKASLRGKKVELGGRSFSASFLLWRLVRAITERTYAGIRLQARIQEALNKELEERLTSNIFGEQMLDDLLPEQAE